MSFQNLEIVKKLYPNAETTIYSINRLLNITEEKLGLFPNKLMHVDSVCCDDSDAIHYPARLHEMLGPFKMSGLSGYPFTGISGMNDFADHAPKDGAVVIFYAPHIDITKGGIIGRVHRLRKGENPSCCNPTKSVLVKLLKNQIKANHIYGLDHQMNTIEQIVLKQSDRIKSAKNKLFEATEVMYEAINDKIEVLVSRTNYPCKYVVLAGAIFITVDKDRGSFFSYKRLDLINLETQERTDLMDDFYAQDISATKHAPSNYLY